MKDKDRDLLDDLFRQKLQHIEADTAPEDWEAIARQLPEAKVIPSGWRRRYWAAAACVALLLGGGGIYLSLQHDGQSNAPSTIGQTYTPGQETLIPQEPLVETPVATPAEPSGAVAAKETLRQPAATPLSGEKLIAKEGGVSPDTILPKDIIMQKPAGNLLLIADAAPVQTAAKKTSSLRKWGFGTGMGFTQSSGEVVNTYVLRSNNYLEDEELLSLNAASDQNLGKLPKTNIKHKLPVSFGFSASRYLNERFSLQSGLVYSLLISDWEIQAPYSNKTRQTLHFVGIPLSLSYKIAEWNRFLVYASAGAQADVNVAGQLRVKRYSNNLQTGVAYINQRMKEWQWSANARAGISYPLIPYISVFGEVGTAYYFDNGSYIETIYSDKVFTVSPQIGFRLSF